MTVSPEKLEKMRKTQLNILIEFHRVCEELGVNYTLSSGTLLGAVRHGGFIPWDDDIDVSMLREDYDRFVAEGQRLLPEHLFIQTHETDKNHLNGFGKIRDTSTILKELSTQHFDMKHGVYIDIFPIDRVSSNKIIRRLDNLFLAIIKIIKHSYHQEWISNTQNKVKRIVKKIITPLLRKCLSINRLNRIETYIRTKNNKEKNRYTYADRYMLRPTRLKDSMLMPIEMFFDYCDIEFEGYTFRAIKDWDAYLRIIYGDYMKQPPEHERIPKHKFVELEFNIK